ncbi:hypothetical protein VCHC59B1_3427A, partial [Vibrio cholerae HC-59B1]
MLLRKMHFKQMCLKNHS